RGGVHAQLVLRVRARGDLIGADADRLRGLQPDRAAGTHLRGARLMGDEGQRTGPGRVAVAALVAFVLLFLIAPVVIILIVSFSGADYLRFPPPSLSLRWYQRFFGVAAWRQAIWTSTQVLALPVVVIIIAATLQGFDVRFEQAALSLGASRLTALRRVTLPLIMPGVLSAALFAFLTSFDELLIPLFLSGVEVQTLTVRVWNSLLLEVDPTIAAVSSFLIGVTAAVLGASALFRGRGEVPGS